jgi:hypothetical protein
MTLQPHDLQSAVWRKLQAHFEEQVAIDRSRLEQDQDKKQTLKCRTRI